MAPVAPRTPASAIIAAAGISLAALGLAAAAWANRPVSQRAAAAGHRHQVRQPAHVPEPAGSRASGQPAAGNGPPAPGRAAVGTQGSFWVGQFRLTVTEPARTAPAGQRLGPRTLLTLIRYPAAGSARHGRPRPAAGRFPLIVFAPGFRQCGTPYARLLRAWASAGYVVAVVNFPRSDCLAGPATEADLVNQPGDVSYEISWLLAASARHAGLLAGLLDPHQVAIAGQSDGGDTVAAVAANSCCADRRVTAVAVLSGAEWPPMPGRYFPGRTPPMLLVQGSADQVNPSSFSLQLYRADGGRERYYLDLLGAGHMTPYVGANPVERITARVTLAFFDRWVLGQLAAGPAMSSDGTVPGAAVLVSGGRLPPR